MTAKAGAVEGDAGRKQHVDLGRKLGQRRRLLERVGGGAVYAPFCGDGDIAAEMYADRGVWAADLDPDRVATAQRRLPDAVVRVADCDEWPFADVETPRFAVADFDSYSYPYDSFRAWWEAAERCDPVAVLVTDGQPQCLKRKRPWRRPSGEEVAGDSPDRRANYNHYWVRIVKPWLEEIVAEAGWHVVATEKYLRGGNMLYWGAVLSRSEAGDEGDGPRRPSDEVEASLYEAAVSGNVQAIAQYRRSDGARGLGQAQAAEETIGALRAGGKLETADAAAVQIVRGLARAVDADPTNAQLWKQYREALDRLRVDDSDDGEIASLLARMSSAMGDPSKA